MSSSIEVPESAVGAMPKHVAIIMDGNNRWAKHRSKAGVSGHKAGVDAVRAVVETSVREGIDVLTLFAFSSENWRRPKDEVSALMKLFIIDRKSTRLNSSHVRISYAVFCLKKK